MHKTKSSIDFIDVRKMLNKFQGKSKLLLVYYLQSCEKSTVYLRRNIYVYILDLKVYGWSRMYSSKILELTLTQLKAIIWVYRK